LKKLLATVRLSAIIALLVVSSAEGQQPPVAPGTPAPPAPQAMPAPQTTPAPQTPASVPAPAQQPLQRQPDTTPTPRFYAPWSLGVSYWFTSTTPSLRGGAAAADFENLDYPGHGNYTPALSLSIPVSRTAMLDFSGFISKASTNSTATQALDLFGTSYVAGDYLASDYKITNFKLSFQDLLYPYPRKAGQKWNIKTLWEVQYASVTTNINAPFAPTTDSSGNALTTTATGRRTVVYPTFGLAAEYHFTRNLEFQVKGSGFALPHHSTIGDAEGSLGYHLGAIELVVADRYYHFKTSVQNAEYFKVTMNGPYVALRLFPSQVSIPCLFCKQKTAAANTGGATSTGADESAVSTSKTGTSSSAKAGPSTYVHRFSAGATLSVLGLRLVPGGTNTVTNSATVNTMYQTTDASSRIGYGVTAQVAVTDHFAINIGGLIRRLGYQFTTTVTTNKPTVISGVVTTVTTSTINHEDTRARLYDIPAVVRFYSKGRHDPGPRWFVEGGAAWRAVRNIRTSQDFTDASSVLSCCTTTPAQPEHSSIFGITAGAGVEFIDPFGIHIVPEVRYTRWMNPIFNAFTTNTQRNEVAAGFSITF